MSSMMPGSITLAMDGQSQTNLGLQRRGERVLRLFADSCPIVQRKNLWFAPNVLLQKFPAEAFMVTPK